MEEHQKSSNSEKQQLDKYCINTYFFSRNVNFTYKLKILVMEEQLEDV